MKMSHIKQIVMHTLINHKDRLAICPSLVIDRLFDSLDIDAINNIIAIADGSNVSHRMIWDRYLHPVLCIADQNVKVFARESN